MDDLNKLPAPPKGQTGISPELFSHLPAPPQGQVGIHPNDIGSIQTQQPQPQGLLNKIGNSIGNAFKSGVNQVKQGFQQAQSATNPIQALESGATVGAGAVNTALSPLAPVMSPVGKGVNALADKISNNPAVQNFAMSKAGQTTSRVAQDVVNLSTIAGVATGGAGAPEIADTIGQTANKVGQGYDAFKANRGIELAQKELQDTTNLVRPKLTPTMEAEAKASGQGTTKGGLLNKVTINPSPKDTEMGQFAHEAGVSSKNTFDKNIQLMKDAQKTSAQNLRSGLEQAQGSWNKNDVIHALKGIETPITVKSDPVLTKLAGNFKKAIVGLVNQSEKKPVGLLDLRQGVDDLISKEFPSNIYHKDTPVGQYVRQVRQALNSMAENKLPEGKLPNGQTFRGELRRQSLLYDAIDNVAEKAPKVGESARPIIQKAKGFIQKHPYVTAGISGAVGGGAVTKAISSL